MKLTELIENNEAARMCGRHRRTLYLWRKKGLGPKYYQIAGRFFYDPADINEFLSNCHIDPQKQ